MSIISGLQEAARQILGQQEQNFSDASKIQQPPGMLSGNMPQFIPQFLNEDNTKTWYHQPNLNEDYSTFNTNVRDIDANVITSNNFSSPTKNFSPATNNFSPDATNKIESVNPTNTFTKLPEDRVKLRDLSFEASVDNGTVSRRDARKAARIARRDTDGDGVVSGNEFISSGAGAAVNAAAGIAAAGLNIASQYIGEQANAPAAQQLDETQNAVRSGIYSAVSAVPVWGPIISAGMQIQDAIGAMTGGQISSISKSAADDAGLNRGVNNVLATIPGVGSMLGFFTRKANEFEFDRSRVDNIGSAYDMSTFDSADDLSGGKFIGQTDKVNRFIAEQNRKKDLMTGISDVQRMRKEGASSAAADLAQQNRNRYRGITGQQFAIGKKGMKLDLSWARGLLSKFQKGSKTEPKRRTLDELKAYADSINPNFIQRANSKDIDYITWTKDGKTYNGTHLLSYELNPEDNQWYVFPSIQEINGKLIKIDDPWEALDSAIKYKDFIIVNGPEEGKIFTEHYKEIYPAFQKFQKGGKLGQPGIESNVIVEGAYHAHKNHLDEVNPELSDMTPKGIPVATEDPDGVKTQVAEIEVGELILTKELTEKLEALYKDGSDEAAIQAGMLFAEEIIDNTVDNKGGVIDE